MCFAFVFLQPASELSSHFFCDDPTLCKRSHHLQYPPYSRNAATPSDGESHRIPIAINAVVMEPGLYGRHP